MTGSHMSHSAHEPLGLGSQNIDLANAFETHKKSNLRMIFHSQKTHRFVAIDNLFGGCRRVHLGQFVSQRCRGGGSETFCFSINIRERVSCGSCRSIPLICCVFER